MLDFIFKKKPSAAPVQPVIQGTRLLIGEPQVQVVATLDYDGNLRLKLQARCGYKLQPDGSLVYATSERIVAPNSEHLQQVLDSYKVQHGSGVSQDSQMMGFQALLVASQKGEV